MKTNIVLVGSLYNQTTKIAEKLSEKFDLYYANVEDIITYRLFNANDIKKKCGVAYLKKLKKDLLFEIGTFENTLICIDKSMFLENKNYELLKTYGTIVFLNFPKIMLEKLIEQASEKDKKKLQVSLLTYDEKNELCEDKSDVVVQIKKDNFESNCKLVSKVIEKYYL